jgi:hypothetical protein
MSKNDKDIEFKEKELELKSMEQSKEILETLTNSLGSRGKIIMYTINSIGFLSVCLIGLFGKYQADKWFWLLLALMPFTLFVSEKKLLHDLIEAMITLIVNTINLPKNIGSKLFKK